MGQSQLADALTGLVIPKGERVVALLVERRRGGYPDATTHAAIAPLSPSQSFEPVSLPVHAVAGAYGDIEPGRNDLGAKLVLHLANKATWTDLSEAAFGVDGSVILGEAAHGIQKAIWTNPGDREPRTLGLVAFHASSWDRIVFLGTRGRGGKGDVDTVLGAIEAARTATAASDHDLAAMNYGLTHLGASVAYARDPGEPGKTVTVPMPDLARALSKREGGDLLSSVSTRWLERTRLLGPRILDAAPDPRLRVLLESVRNLQAAERGMDLLCKTWQPSYGAGQHDNALEVAEAAIGSLSRAAGQSLDRIEEGTDERALPRLEAMLARLDEVRAALGERVEAARADTSPAP